MNPYGHFASTARLSSNDACKWSFHCALSDCRGYCKFFTTACGGGRRNPGSAANAVALNNDRLLQVSDQSCWWSIIVVLLSRHITRRSKRKHVLFPRTRLLHGRHDCISQALKLWCVQNGLSRFQSPMYCLDGSKGFSRVFNNAWHTAFSGLVNTACRHLRPAARKLRERSHGARPPITTSKLQESAPDGTQCASMFSPAGAS